MQFGIIDAEKKSATLQEFDATDDVWSACASVGLRPGAVDFGAISRWMHIIVFEHGLYVPVEKQNYFAIGSQLFAGNAVIFAANEYGETISLDMLPPIIWFRDADAVELAIQRGDVARPIISTGETIHWQWNITGQNV